MCGLNILHKDALLRSVRQHLVWIDHSGAVCIQSYHHALVPANFALSLAIQGNGIGAFRRHNVFPNR